MNPYSPSPNQIPSNNNNPPQNVEMGMVQPQMIYVPQNNTYQQPQYGYVQPAYPQYNATQTTYIQMQQPTYAQVNQNAMAPYTQPQQMPHPQYPVGNDDRPPQVDQKPHEKKEKNKGPKRYRTYRAASQGDIDDEVSFLCYAYMWMCCRVNNNSCSRSPCCICCCDSTDHQSTGSTCCCNASCFECDGDCCKLDCCELKGCCCKIDGCDVCECCDLNDCCSDFKCDFCDCDICGSDD